MEGHHGVPQDKEHQIHEQLLGHKSLKNTDTYTQLINLESDEWHIAHARNLEEKSKLIEAGFEYVRYKDDIAIYRKRK